MSIYIKSAAIVIVCMGLGVWAMGFVAMDTFKSEAISHTERENQKATELLSQDLGRELKMFVSKMNTMTEVVKDSLLKKSLVKGSLAGKISTILNSEDDFVSFGVYQLNQDKYEEVFFMAKPESLAEFGFQLSDLKNFSPDTLALDVKQSPTGFRFGGLAPAFKSTLINFSYLIRTAEGGTWLVRSEVRQDHWVRLLNHYPNLTSSILDSKNKVIISSDADLNSKSFDEGSDLVTSYQDLNLGDLKVAVSSQKQAFVGVEKSLDYRLMLVGIMILASGLIVSILFSSHLVTPLKNLRGILEKVISGQGDVTLSVLRGDEIGSLARDLSQLMELFKNKSTLAFKGGTPTYSVPVAALDHAMKSPAPQPMIKLVEPPTPQPRQRPVIEGNQYPLSQETAIFNEVGRGEETQIHSSPQNSSSQKEGWFLVRNSQSSIDEGPFSLEELKAISNEPGFIVAQAYIYRTGDSYMTPLIQMAGLSRRNKTRPSLPENAAPTLPSEVQAQAKADEWYLYGDKDRTLGPYSITQLKQALDEGQLPRTTYCWRQGMTRWIFVYEIPDFDRRNPGPPMPPLPIGKVA